MRNANPCDLRETDAKPTDHFLLGRFRTGEQEAATQIYARYANRLEAWASSQTSPSLTARFDPEDVVQSVFRTLFRRVSHGLYDVPPGKELWQLLLVLTLNKIRKLATYHRAQKRDVTRTLGSDGLEHAQPQQHASDETSLHMLRMLIEELMGDLPTANRDIIQLRIEGHGVDVIAQRTQRAKRTVERVLQEFRHKLSALIHGGSSSP